MKNEMINDKNIFNKRLVSKIGIFLVVIISMLLLNMNTTYAAKSKYYIKVNKKTNVATVYKTSNNKPYKTFLVSCGSATPRGTFYTMNKYTWRALVENMHGQYATRITGRILFHSVPYNRNGNKASMFTKEYNKLGKLASHGCVRLSVENAKWIYNNCPLRTKVIIFSGSSKNDPLGKPKLKKISTKTKYGWDPTDPDKKNPYNKMTFYGIKSGTKTVSFGKKVNVLKGVSVKNKAGRNLTSKIKVTVKIPGATKAKSTKAKTYTLNKVGTYTFKYTVTDSRNKLKKTLTAKYKVVDDRVPTITGVEESKNVEYMSTKDIKTGIVAKDSAGKDITNAMVIKIKYPDATAYVNYTSGTVLFDKIGQYTIQYSVANPSNNKIATKTVVYTSIDTKAPTFIGIKDETVTIGTDFNVMSGVFAKKISGKDITSKITYVVTDPSGSKITAVNNIVKCSVLGQYLIKYFVSDDLGNSINKEKKLNVMN